MSAQVKVTPSEDDKKRLISNPRCRTMPIRLVARSKIMLLASQGQPSYKIAQELGLDVNQVGRWRNRFVESGFAGIAKGRPRGVSHGGKNSEAQAKPRSKVIRIITQEKPAGATHWSTRGLARRLGLRHSFVHSVWSEAGLKPHLTVNYKVCNDPDFEEQLHDVVGLYLSPPEHEVVFCVDEKNSIQALDRAQPGLPMKPDRCGTLTHDDKRNGASTLFAALNTLTGEVIGQCHKRHRRQELLSFSKAVNKQTPADKALH